MLRSILKDNFRPQNPHFLSFRPQFFKSHPTPISQRRKYYASHPELYRRITKMRPPDLTKKEMTFPITIPIRIRYMYYFKPRTDIPSHDFLNFKMMKGNEILLYLENPSELRTSEICGALSALGKIEASKSRIILIRGYLINYF